MTVYRINERMCHGQTPAPDVEPRIDAGGGRNVVSVDHLNGDLRQLLEIGERNWRASDQATRSCYRRRHLTCWKDPADWLVGDNCFDVGTLDLGQPPGQSTGGMGDHHGGTKLWENPNPHPKKKRVCPRHRIWGMHSPTPILCGRGSHGTHP